MAKQEKHIHRFKRLKYKSGNQIFFCTLPDCNQKINTALALGKQSLCWRCGEPFTMTEYSLRLAKPHCENCHKPKHESVHYSGESGIIEEAVMEMSPALTLAERFKQTIKTKEEEDEI